MSGLAATFEHLRKSKSPAAIEVWLEALQTSRSFVALPALSATRKGAPTEVQTAIIERWHELQPNEKLLVRKDQQQYVNGLRASLKADDPKLRANAFAMILSLRAYALIPDLVKQLEIGDSEMVASAGRVLVRLTDRLAPTREVDISADRDPHQEAVRRQALEALSQSLQRFQHHHREEILAAFLRLAHRDHHTLRELLGEPGSVGLAAAFEDLSKRKFDLIPDRLLIDFLADQQVPPSIVSLWGVRDAPDFVESLLRSIGQASEQPSLDARIQVNLQRLYEAVWLEDCLERLDQLSDDGRLGLLRICQFSGLAEETVCSTLFKLLDHAEPDFQVTCVHALDAIRNESTDRKILELSKTSSGMVRAAALRQLKPRQLPSAMSILLAALEDEEPLIRETAAEAFSDFTIDSFIDGYEIMDQTARKSTGKIVGLVDPSAPDRLRIEMRHESSLRRGRAVEIAVVLGLVDELLDEISEVLASDKPVNQILACEALACSTLPEAKTALQTASQHTDEDVNEAARRALADLEHLSPQPKSAHPANAAPAMAH